MITQFYLVNTFSQDIKTWPKRPEMSRIASGENVNIFSRATQTESDEVATAVPEKRVYEIKYCATISS